jgi:hypothetical protein
MPRRQPPSTHTDPRRHEWLKCSLSFPYWLDEYGHIYDATARRWIRFRLWPGQRAVAEAIAPPAVRATAPRRGEAPQATSTATPTSTPIASHTATPEATSEATASTSAGLPRDASSLPTPPGAPPPPRARLFVILKARQLGMTWLAVGFALWLMLFRPAATTLLFSKRDDEAVHLLRFRLRGMYERLPQWMRARSRMTDNDHELILSNGSAALAFPTTGGRSYTATMALVDEADHMGELDRLLDAVKPTVDAGGWLILLSTADKAEPGSTFKRIYQAAQRGENGYTPVFLPWHARPDRTPEWYEAIRRDYLARDGTPDALHGEYPATDVEALAGRQSDRRFPGEWLSRIADCVPASLARLPNADCRNVDGVFNPQSEIRNPQSSVPSLTVFVPPVSGRSYVIGADPAEGNPQSDESAASVVDALTGEQVAVLAGRYEPGVFAAGLADTAWFYNGAAILVERNNHGHAVLLWLAEHRWDWMDPACAAQPMPYSLLRGWDGRPGWLSTGRGKALAFDAAADAVREGQTRLRDRVTLEQMMAIRGATLSAPQGERDDRAVAHVLALAALRWCDQAPAGPGTSHQIAAPDPIAEADAGGFG